MLTTTGRRTRRLAACVFFSTLLAAFEAAQAQTVSPAAAAVKRANAAYKAEDYRTAITLFEDALSRDASQSDLYFFLGSSYDHLHNPARKDDALNDSYLMKAVENYRTASRVSGSPELRKISTQYLVSSYISPDKLNDPAAAEAVLLGMIAADPDDVNNHVVLSRVYEDAGDHEAAEQQLTSTLLRHPQDPAVYMNLAGFYQRTGNVDKMIDAVQERTRQEPENPEAFYTLATFYWERASRGTGLSDEQRSAYAQAGLEALDRALDLKRDYFEALTYKNLLLRTQAGLSKEPTERDALTQQADDLRRLAEDLRQRQRAGTVPTSQPALD